MSIINTTCRRHKKKTPFESSVDKWQMNKRKRINSTKCIQINFL